MERKRCPYCTRTFDDLETLEQHFRVVHETQPMRVVPPNPPAASTVNKAATTRRNKRKEGSSTGGVSG